MKLESQLEILSEFQSQRNSRFLYKILNQNAQNLWNSSRSGETVLLILMLKAYLIHMEGYFCLLYILGVWAFPCFGSVFFTHVK